MATDPSEKQPFRILFVCTGNVCRSPLAERLGRAFLDVALGPDASQVGLASAGVQAVVDSAMHPDSALVLQGLGGDAAGFRARQLDDRMPAEADLVLTMTRRQRRAVLERAPKALSRTFTLPEAAALLGRIDDRRPDGADLAERARGLGRLLAEARPGHKAGAADDVTDPVGRPLEVHQKVGDVIAEALLPLLTRIAALGDEPDGRGVAAAAAHSS